jgi:hypothetical protein
MRTKKNQIKRMPNQRSKSGSLAMITSIVGLLIIQSQAQTTIPSGNSLASSAADTSKPGFLWRVHQVATGQPTTLDRTEAQLAGLLGDNIADPNAPGAATGVAAPPNPSTAPIEFILSGVVNLNQVPGDAGNFPTDEQMPGIPGTTASTDNIAAEVLTWLDLPVGEIVMGVNSDDGFRVTIGGANPTDKFGVNVGEFNAGRAAGDTIFRFTITKAGLYAARLIYNEGGSDASVEWFTQKTNGTKVLVNDVANGGIPAYRAIVGSAAAATLTQIRPGINQVGAFPNASLDLVLTEGATSIDPATINVTIDGNPVSAIKTKNGKAISVKYTPTVLYAPSTIHQVVFNYTEGTAAKSLTWKFTVSNYGTLTPAMKVTADTTKAGFNWNIFANPGNTTTSNQRAEDALAGLLKETDGSPTPNLADPTTQGVASGPATPANPANAPLHFEIPGVINLTQNSTDELDNKNGNFVPDLQMPGVPPSDVDGIAAEVVTYLELPAGVVTMGVNSDDGFRTTAGIPQDVFGSLVLGEFDAGRGAADTIFAVVVQEAGVYAFRTLWEEGTGGANIEWFTVKSDGTKVLVNDTANGGVKAYRAKIGGTVPFIKSVSPTIVPRQVNQPGSTVSLVLADGSTAVDDNSISLKLDGQPVTITKDRQGSTVTVTYTPSTLQIPDQEHTAEITFKDSTGNYTRTQQWKFRNLKNIVLPAPVLTENFDSYAEGSVPTGWNAINFTDDIIDDSTGLPYGEDLDILNSATYKGWIVVSRTRLEGLKSRIFNVAPGQTVNGVEVTSLSDGNLLYAESDVRDDNQVQFITSAPFNLSTVTNVVMSMSSLYEQNQDSIGAVEYSVDGGTSWLPVVYFLDIADSGGDIKLNPDGTVDAVTTLTGPNADTAAWVDNGVPKGDKYGDGILAPITQALAAYIAPRINDNSTIDKRVEVFSLPQAGKKSDVRLRFSQLGTGSWYFGVDNIAFYEGPAPVSSGQQSSLAVSKATGGQITISWTGTGTLESSDNVNSGWATAASQTNPQTITPVGAARFFRIRQ